MIGRCVCIYTYIFFIGEYIHLSVYIYPNKEHKYIKAAKVIIVQPCGVNYDSTVVSPVSRENRDIQNQE